MNWAQQCVAVVPCQDEGGTIGALVRGIRRHLQAVIVVDDGSRDHTGAEAAKAGATVFRHAANLGKGAALRSGLAAARQAGFTWAALLDGDGQHKPDDLPAMFACAERSGAALVVGNRMHNPRVIPLVRRHVNWWMSRKLSRRSGRHLPDTQCGFRLVDLEAWQGLRLTTGRFEVESEMLLAFIQAGHRVEFVPIRAVGRGPHSHIAPVLDTWRWLKWWKLEALKH